MSYIKYILEATVKIKKKTTLKWRNTTKLENTLFFFHNKWYTYGLPKKISYQVPEQPMWGSKAEQLSPCHKSEMPNLVIKHWSLSYNRNKEVEE